MVFVLVVFGVVLLLVDDRDPLLRRPRLDCPELMLLLTAAGTENYRPLKLNSKRWVLTYSS